jgi:hypothetical protein
VRRDPDAIEAAAKAIWNLVPIPDDLLRDVYAGGDQELYQLARSALRSTRIDPMASAPLTEDDD